MENLSSCYACIRQNKDGPQEIHADMMVGSHRGLILARFTRKDGEWLMQNLSLPKSGRVANDFKEACRQVIFGIAVLPEGIRSNALEVFNAEHASDFAAIRDDSWWSKLLRLIGVRS